MAQEMAAPIAPPFTPPPATSPYPLGKQDDAAARAKYFEETMASLAELQEQSEGFSVIVRPSNSPKKQQPSPPPHDTHSEFDDVNTTGSEWDHFDDATGSLAVHEGNDHYQPEAADIDDDRVQQHQYGQVDEYSNPTPETYAHHDNDNDNDNNNNYNNNAESEEFRSGDNDDAKLSEELKRQLHQEEERRQQVEKKNSELEQELDKARRQISSLQEELKRAKVAAAAARAPQPTPAPTVPKEVLTRMENEMRAEMQACRFEMEAAMIALLHRLVPQTASFSSLNDMLSNMK